MSNLPILAKYTCPRPNNIHHRLRLYTLLDKTINTPVIWISSPAGSGKTTCTASYFQSHNSQPTLWYQIDDGDADIASFFYHMGQAVTQHAPSAPSLPLFTSEYLGGVNAFARNYAREWFSHLPQPGFVVLDNYQDAGFDCLLHETLATCFSQIPTGLHVIVLSRTDPPAAFARMRANNQLKLIDWNMLKLTEAEAKSICALRFGSNLTPETLTQLYQQSAGWVAGLVLLLEQINERGTDLSAQDNLSHNLIFDYFAGEVFRRTKPETQEFLLKTALLPKVTIEAAKTLTQNNAAEKILRQLSQRNYFTNYLDQRPAAYEYHPLFRAFLISQGERHYHPETLQRLQQQAAELLAQRGDINDAVTLFIHSSNWELANNLIIQHAENLVSQGRWATLTSWIDKLPDAFVKQKPWLLYWLGVCKTPFSPINAREFIENAYHLFKQHDNFSGQLMAWCAIVDTFIYEFGEFTPLDFWLDEIETVLNRNTTIPSKELETKLARGMFIALMFRRPHHPSITIWENKAWDIVLGNNDLGLRLSIGAYLLLFYSWWRGDLSKAGVIFNTLKPLMLTSDHPPIISTTWYFIAAAYAWMMAEDGQAIDYAKTGIDIAHDTGVHIWEVFTTALAVFGALSSNQLDLAQVFISKMKDHPQVYQLQNTGVYLHVKAWHALLSGNLSKASELAEAAYHLMKHSGNFHYTAATLDQLARMRLYEGNTEQALDLVAQAHNAAQEMDSLSVEYLTRLTQAEIAMKAGDHNALLSKLKDWLTLARKSNFRNHTYWQPTVLSTLYAIALEHDIETDYVASIVKQRKLAPPAFMSATLDHWPWAVRIYTLGSLKIIVDDKPITFKGKAQLRILDLVGAMITLGGRDINTDALSAILWPDAEGDDAKHALKTLTYRLRKLLGKESVLVSEGQISFNAKRCWVDAWSFEKIYKQLSNERHDHTKEPSTLVQQLITLYHGSFLAQTDAVWSLTTRDRLRTQMLHALELCAERAEQSGRWRDAQILLQRGIDLDPLSENLYRRLMLCYHKLGQNAEALSVYRRCQRTLSVNLGIPPSSETVAFAHKLRLG